MFNARSCGILLHPTSLPGPGGIGSFGSDARRFVDLLAQGGITLWQMLPLTPPACGDSPYSSLSVFAGNPLLIDLDRLAEEGDLAPEPYGYSAGTVSGDPVDYATVARHKLDVLGRAAKRFMSSGRNVRMESFWHFCDTSPWLHDYALFMSLKNKFQGVSWHKWPASAARLDHAAYERFSVELGEEIGVQKYIQWQFYVQWQELRGYANSRGVRIIGDIPIFVAYDSVDVWRNRHLFLLDAKGKPTVVAGVPPDYFSSNGQLWGNPLYNWKRLEQEGYSWWVDRIRHSLSLFDGIRIDHFRGFESAWHVPASHKTARNGMWFKGPGRQLFDVLRHHLGALPIIAEDLGVITPEVIELKQQCGFPGMKILQFAFDSGVDNPYLPHNYDRNCVVYTGTHDNDTTCGWFESLTTDQRRQVCEYLGCGEGAVVEGMFRQAMISVADTAIFPMQDVLGLGSCGRMNTPGVAFGNWSWRFDWQMINRQAWMQFTSMIKLYGRVGQLVPKSS